MENEENDLNKFYDSNLFSSSEKTDKITELNNLTIEPIFDILKLGNYLCGKCLKFPYIKFSKNRRTIKLTCFCNNNKKIFIKDLQFLNKENNNSNFFSENNSIHDKSYGNESNSNLNDDKSLEKKFLCMKHNKKYIGFSKKYMVNCCQSCIEYKNNNEIIRFDDIKIEDQKLEQLFKQINNDNETLEESNTYNTFKVINIKDDSCDIISKEEEQKFNKLSKIS